jgi:RNA polymerase sigma factor (sigma-70 family)
MATGATPQPGATGAPPPTTPLKQDILDNLGPLRDFVRRQLRLHEGYGDLKRSEVLADEIVDQVVVMALEQRARPAGEGAYAWLRGLARRALDTAVADARAQDALVDESDLGNALAPDANADTGAVGRPQEFVSAASQDDADQSPEDDAVVDELRANLARALTALPEPEREALLLQWRDGRTLAEVARAEGISDAEARRRVGAAERELRANLVELYGADNLPAPDVMAQAIERTPLSDAQLARITARFGN